MKIYVASSWRHPYQSGVVAMLRDEGFDVYDFKNPPNNSNFSWRDLDPNWETWTSAQYRAALNTDIALEGYRSDRNAIINCDVLLFVAPAGRSASWELGYATALKKRTAILALEAVEPELMFFESTILVSFDEFIMWLGSL